MMRAGVIGAGPAGLALALRLQAAGVATTVVEALAHPGGGLAAQVDLPGIGRVDAHPAPLADPAGWRELWALAPPDPAGAEPATGIRPLPVDPLRRLNWPDATQMDWTADPAALARDVARLAPGDLAGFEEFLALSRRLVASRRLPRRVPARRTEPSRLAALVHALPDWFGAHGWQSLDARAAGLVRSGKLRQALAHQPLLAGRNPLTTPAMAAGALADELDRGLWWPEGGLAPLLARLAARFTALGGELRLADPATAVLTLGNRATGVACASGWQAHFDCVASTADPMHTAHTLLAGTEAGSRMTRRLRRRRWTPALFTVHFALAGAWPGIAHDTLLFAQRWEDLLGDIDQRGLLPTDMIIRLLHPTVTDPTLAPAGHSLFTAQVPVAHLGLLPLDWETTGPLMQRRVLDEIGRRLIPDIYDRVLAATHRTPRDHALDYNAWLGSAAGPEPSRLSQVSPESAVPPGPIANLWQFGAGEGAGGSFLATASATANRIIAAHSEGASAR